MSVPDAMKKIFVLDIETAGHPDRMRFIPEPKVATHADAPASMKKHETRVNWAIRKYRDNLAKYADAVAKMALDVDLCRIVTIAWKVQITDGDAFITNSEGADDEIEEAAMLTQFWKDWIHYASRTCGFNVMRFDLPIIMRRSWALDVKGSYPIPLRPYSTDAVIDLMQEFYGWGKYPGKMYRGLKTLANMYDIPVPLKDVDGSQVALMTKQERCEYCASDVEVTWELARRMYGLYWT